MVFSVPGIFDNQSKGINGAIGHFHHTDEIGSQAGFEIEGFVFGYWGGRYSCFLAGPQETIPEIEAILGKRKDSSL